jgi:cytochrome P450
MSHQEVVAAALLPLPPGPPRLRTLVGLFRFLTGGDRILSISTALQQYGDILLTRLGRTQIYFVSNPDMAQECLVTRHRDFQKSGAYFLLRLVLGNGLLTSEGSFHLRQRRMMQPAFHRERLRAYGNAMIEFSMQARDAYQDGQTTDMNRDMMRVTLYIVAKALFGTDVSEDAPRVGKSLDTLMELDVVFANPLGPFIAKLPLPINRKRIGMTRDLDDVMYRMIKARRASGDTGDLLSMLLAARDEDDNTGMTDEQVRNEAVTLFLAGHETTANALTWTWYLLAQHPEVEARFHAELDRVLEGRDPTPEDFGRLVYTRQVLAESMRLYPPIWVVGREAVCDTQLGGYHLPKGSQVFITTYFVHRDPRWYPDPERFDPERFSEENSVRRPKFAYFPFGGGNRLCIGEGFAWMEGVLVLATIGQRWKFRLANDKPVKPDPSFTLRPKGGLKMVAAAR